MTDLNLFCGWPVNGKPCGKPVEPPGCAFCDEHGKVFYLRTEEQIIDRAAARKRRFRNAVELAIVSAVVAATVLIPIRGWLYLHREFWWGVLAGSSVEALVILGRRWAWDRVLWMRWFSR